MDWGSLHGIYLFGFLLLFMAGGFILGYLLGYFWTLLDEKTFLKTEEEAELQNELNQFLEAGSEKSLDMGLIRLVPVPNGDRPRKHTKVYAKGA